VSGSVSRLGSIPTAESSVVSDADDYDAFIVKWNRIRPDIEKWEADHHKRRRIAQVFLGLFSCFIVPSFLFLRGPDEWDFTIFLVLGGVACVGAVFVLAKGMSDYGPWRAKACVFEHLGYFYDRRARKFPFQRFEQLYLLPTREKIRGADHIEGRIDGVGSQICKAEEIEEENRKRSSYLFEGCLIVADFPKSFHGRTVVLPNDFHPRNLFSGAFQNIGERVELESDDFNSAFIVYSTDQVEARYLLTPTMMERLLRLRKLTVRGLGLGFDEGKVWIAFNDQRDWFPDPGGNGDAADPACLEEMKKELDYIAVIFRELDLAATSKI
tara:strand:- start:140 stop:1117 length:978 start_codon:yes stop_codon:yes gene_type:complete